MQLDTSQKQIISERPRRTVPLAFLRNSVLKPLRYELHGFLGWLPIKESSHLPQEKAIRLTAISVCNDTEKTVFTG